MILNENHHFARGSLVLDYMREGNFKNVCRYNYQHVRDNVTNKALSILFSAGVVILTALFVWHGHRPVTAKVATWEDVLIEARIGGYQTITTEELSKRYHDDTESTSCL